MADDNTIDGGSFRARLRRQINYYWFIVRGWIWLPWDGFKALFLWIEARSWTLFILKYGFTLIPPILVAASRFEGRYDIPPVDWIVEQIRGSNRLFLIVLSMPVIATFTSKIFSKIMERLRRSTLTATFLENLFANIGKAVGEKAIRFESACSDKALKKASSSEIFGKITLPEQQIQYILDGVWRFFTLETGSKDVRIVLAKMEKGHIESYFSWTPKHPRPYVAIEQLQHDDSGFSRALASKQLLIIADIEKERAKPFRRNFRYVDGDVGKGSMLLYPIQHGVTYPLVLSVYIDTPNALRARDSAKWSRAMDCFGIRIALEWSLHTFKQRTVRVA